MSTFMAKPENITRSWYILDAAGKPLGRTAALAAHLLHGKHKAEFTPNQDTGDYVIIINTDKAVLTGRKGEQKFYRTHSGYPGGLKEINYRLLMESKSDFAMQLAIKRMLPSNHIGREQLKRLKVFKGEQHNHEAQKPVEWTGKF